MTLEPQNPGAIDAMLDLADKIGTTDMEKAVAVLAEWRKYKPDSVEYLYQNRLGNWEYSRGNYKLAAGHYGLAVQANPSGPVLRSNLALAQAAMRTSGNRHECLTRAIDSLTHAVRLDGKEAQYRERLGRLTIERDFIDAYGEKALEFKAIVTPLRLEVPNEALPAILDTDLKALSKETLDHINAWRTTFRARMGMHLPGVNFTEAEDLERPDRFRMIVMEGEGRIGTLNGESPIDEMLGQLEAFCLEHLTVFVGHQEAFNLLIGLKNDDTTAIIETPGLLTKFVFVLQELLDQAIPITDLASITSTFVAEQRSGVPLTKIALRLATAATARSVEKG